MIEQQYIDMANHKQLSATYDGTQYYTSYQLVIVDNTCLEPTNQHPPVQPMAGLELTVSAVVPDPSTLLSSHGITQDPDLTYYDVQVKTEQYGEFEFTYSPKILDSIQNYPINTGTPAIPTMPPVTIKYVQRDCVTVEATQIEFNLDLSIDSSLEVIPFDTLFTVNEKGCGPMVVTGGYSEPACITEDVT